MTQRKIGLGQNISALFVLLIISLPLYSETKPRPKIELGLAFAGQYLNDYRGSSETQLQAYPIPFFIYRGEIIKADRGGLRAEFMENKRWEFNFSVAGALNGDSDDNRLREGMPELDSAIEMGPSINVNLTGDSFYDGWQFRLPVRAVFTISGDGVHSVGYTANPKLTYNLKIPNSEWRSKLNVGLFYGSDDYHDYYYSVAPEFATADRPAYIAMGGFSGYFTKMSLFKRKNSMMYGMSLQYDYLNGAEFVDSPLVETDHYYSVSFIFAKVLWSKM